MSQTPDADVAKALAAATPETLLTTFAALTHRLHASANSGELHFDAKAHDQIRLQRDQVQAEIIRRMG